MRYAVSLQNQTMLHWKIAPRSGTGSSLQLASVVSSCHNMHRFWNAGVKIRADIYNKATVRHLSYLSFSKRKMRFRKDGRLLSGYTMTAVFGAETYKPRYWNPRQTPYNACSDMFLIAPVRRDGATYQRGAPSSCRIIGSYKIPTRKM